MRFNLLGTEFNGTLHSNVFEDLGFLDFLRRIYEDKELNFLLDIWKRIPSGNSIKMRQEILRDVLNDHNELFEQMVIYLIQLQKFYSLYEQETLDVKYIYFLNLFREFVAFIANMEASLSKLNLTSTVLIEMRNYLREYMSSTLYKKLLKDIEETKEQTQAVYHFSIVKENEDILLFSENGTNISQSLLNISQKLGIEPKNRTFDLRSQNLNPSYHISLAKLFSSEFKTLKGFHAYYKDHFDKDILKLQKEFEFYLLMKRFYRYLDEVGVNYCCPNINANHHIHLTNSIDLTLLSKVERIISNDYKLSKHSHIQLITGVNSGGKTSYLKGLGISYLLFLVGGFVPGKEASLYPFKSFFTHFPNNEDYHVGSGRLNDEELRIEAMESSFNEDCFIILNETFSSTYEAKALNKSQKLIDELINKQVFCLYVTHQHKLFEQIQTPRVIKMSPIVDSTQGNKRLYLIKEADTGVKSYTQDILFQYGLTKAQLEEESHDF